MFSKKFSRGLILVSFLGLGVASSDANAQSILDGAASVSDDRLTITMEPQSGSAGFRHAYINTDQNTNTGYGPMGADFMIQNNRFFIHNAQDNSWVRQRVVRGATFRSFTNEVTWVIPLNAFGPTANVITIDLEDEGFEQTLQVSLQGTLPAPAPIPEPAPVPAPAPQPVVSEGLSGTVVEQSGMVFATLIENDSSSLFKHVFIDSDNTPNTGLDLFGADYMIENNALYSYDSSAGGAWAWNFVLDTSNSALDLSENGNVTEWQLDSSVLSNTSTEVQIILEADNTSISFTVDLESSVSQAPPTPVPPAVPETFLVTKSNFPSDTGEIFANPDRGWWRFPGSDSWPGSNPFAPEVPSVDPADITLTYCPLLLEAGWSLSELQSRVSVYNQRFAEIRAQGHKCIMRVAYNTNSSAPWGDANLATIRRDLSVLGPQVLRPNSDVISFYQAGLIGAFGEWFYTDHFGDQGNISSSNWDDRAEALRLFMDAIGGDHPVALRAPRYKRSLEQNNRLSTAHLNRLSYFNDCFTSSADDLGTFGDPANGKSLNDDRFDLAAWTETVPMGGEACAPPSGVPATCERALSDAEFFHFTYMGIDYHRPSLEAWGNDCHEELSRRLGYRLELLNVETVQPWIASNQTLRFEVLNTGFAAPSVEKSIQWVLESSSGQIIELSTSDSIDIRNWREGESHSETVTISTSGIPDGTYRLKMAIVSDDRPNDLAHTIRLANQGIYEPGTGFHDLDYDVVVD